jgi:hypothetical protein
MRFWPILTKTLMQGSLEREVPKISLGCGGGS